MKFGARGAYYQPSEGVDRTGDHVVGVDIKRHQAGGLRVGNRGPWQLMTGKGRKKWKFKRRR